MIPEGCISLKSNLDLVKFAIKAYNLSVPQGMGFLQPHRSGLSEEEAKKYINKNELSMDYVNGRAVKLHVSFDTETKEHYMTGTWYDHTTYKFEELLKEFGIVLPKEMEHSVACNCAECQRKRR